MPRFTGEPYLPVHGQSHAAAPSLGPPTGHVPGMHEYDYDPPDSGWDLIVKLWRRKYLILAIAFSCAGVGLLASSMIEPRYKAEAQVMVGGQKTSVTSRETVMPGTPPDSSAIRTEGHVISSRKMAARVSQELGLAEDPILYPKDSGGEGLAEWLGLTGAIEQFRDFVDEAVGEIASEGQEAGEETAAPAPAGLSREERTISRVLSGLTVEPMARSSVLRIVSETRDPDLSARIANGFADEFVSHRLNRQEDAFGLANDWLADRLETLRAELSNAEQAVEAYREENNLFSVRSETVVGQQLSELNGAMVEARKALADAEARLAQAQSMSDYTGQADSIPTVLQSPLIISLRTEKAQLERQAAELRSTYTDNHPKVSAVLAQLDDVESGIAVETDRIIASLQQVVEIARQRLDRAEGDMAVAESDMGSSNAATVKLRQLEREADSIRATYVALMSRAKEASLEAGLLEPGAEILSRAVPPSSKSFPPTKLLIVVCVLAGLSIGIIVALLLEKLDSTFRTPEELEDFTGIPSLAVLPRVARRWSGRCEEVIRNPLSPYTDALRMLWAQLSLADQQGELPGVTLFTSAVPGEGKSFTSCSYARLLAAEGKKVVLIDLDWRQPTQHRLFGEKFRRTDMSDLLYGDAVPEEVVHVDRQTGLHVIFNGRLGRSQGRAVSLERTMALLKTLSNFYDVVVVDTSPLHYTPMVLHLARAADRVVLCVKWGGTRRQAVSSEVRNLVRAGVEISGTVITQVEPKKYRRYSDGADRYLRPLTIKHVA